MAKTPDPIEDFEKRCKYFDAWLSSLSELDRSNFIALVNLPSACTVVLNMEHGLYKEMCLFALGVFALRTECDRIQAVLEKAQPEPFPVVDPITGWFP